jgi:uncharacterized membrane protein YkoI
MKLEALMAKTAHLIVERYTRLVLKIDDGADQRSDEAQLKLLGRASLEGCRVSAFHAQGQKAIAGLAKLEAEVAKASVRAADGPAFAMDAANENDVEASQEMEMDDDSGRTPERVEALYREIDRRLAGDGWDAEVPLSEEREVYRVEILDGETVVRTVETTMPAFTYAAAQQAADFPAGPIGALAVRVAQGSALFGWGAMTRTLL